MCVNIHVVLTSSGLGVYKHEGCSTHKFNNRHGLYTNCNASTCRDPVAFT